MVTLISDGPTRDVMIRLCNNYVARFFTYRTKKRQTKLQHADVSNEERQF